MQGCLAVIGESFRLSARSEIPYTCIVMDDILKSVIDPKQGELDEACSRYRVERLYVFGSLATGGFDSECSDIDFLAAFEDRAPTPEYAERFFGLERSLENIFKRPVDLLTVESLKRGGFRNRVSETRRLVYDARDAR